MNKLIIFGKHSISRLLHTYADVRISATYDEKHCYKKSDSVLLTFDDFGSDFEVTELLKILKKFQIKAMFFLQGDWASKNISLVDSIKKNGHIIGNHTYSHADLKKLSREQINEEIKKGVKSEWLRPPRGHYDKRVRAYAQQLGYRICYWTIDSRDWTGASIEEMEHTVMSELRPGAVILFHIHGKYTRDFLNILIPRAQETGFKFTRADEIWG